MPAPLTTKELGRLAAQLGHEHLELERFGEGTRKGVRYTLRCSCGWSSLNFVRVEAALSAGQTHLRKVVDRHLAEQAANGGRVLPGSVGGRL